MAIVTDLETTTFDPRIAPPWARDLVIYELNPRTFTSPDGIGGGSGTFAALEERLPYLADLGVNALWLAGYCAASEHFYGITSVYSCVDPSAFDPVLGDGTAFRRMVDAAHALGVRVVLDVISHGVVSDSPLVAEHPEFFAGSTWGMSDYDYTSPAFRTWWVETWVRWAQDYGRRRLPHRRGHRRHHDLGRDRHPARCPRQRGGRLPRERAVPLLPDRLVRAHRPRP